jgi:lipopolysaccharide export LptBFGC system permease protein LptF
VKKIHLLVGGEVLSLTAVVTAALTSVLFLFRLLQYSEYIFASGDGLMSVFLFIVFLFPNIFKLTIPLSLLVGTTVAIARMSQDREIDAWMSCGVGALRICLAPFLVGLFITITAMSSALYLEPISRQEWLKYKWMYARRNVEQMLESRLNAKSFVSQPFNAGDTDICLYLDWLSEDKRNFKGVFLAMQTRSDRYASVIVAESGSLQRETKNGSFDYVFTVNNGRIYQPLVEIQNMSDVARQAPARFVFPKGGWKALEGELALLPSLGWRVLRFSTMNFSLVNLFHSQFEVADLDEDDLRSKKPVEYLEALRQIRQNPKWKRKRNKVRDHTFFYGQIVIPLSCLFLPVIGVMLGIHDPRRKVGTSYLGMAFVIFGFYAAVMLSQSLPAWQLTPPEVMLVLPPLSLLAIMLVLMRMRLLYPPSVGFLEFLRIELARIRRGKAFQDAVATTDKEGEG